MNEMMEISEVINYILYINPNNISISSYFTVK